MPISNSDFLQAVQIYEARSAITASALRGRSAGTIAAARAFLAALPLRQFATTRRPVFGVCLDEVTETLRVSLPQHDQFWGVSRKCLNIFLRNAFYNTYLNKAYSLVKAELLFELPLDSIVASELRGRCSKRELPPWKGVMHLQPEHSQLYQDVARRIAEEKGLAPVHLDAMWWGGDRTKPKA